MGFSDALPFCGTLTGPSGCQSAQPLPGVKGMYLSVLPTVAAPRVDLVGSLYNNVGCYDQPYKVSVLNSNYCMKVEAGEGYVVPGACVNGILSWNKVGAIF